MRVIEDKCVGCGLCAQDCPLGLIEIVDKKARINEGCVNCMTCFKVCPKEALEKEEEIKPGVVKCNSCPIMCEIPPDKVGACQRFVNKNGKLIRNIPLHLFEDVKDVVGEDFAPSIKEPLITGIGAGTTYPDFKPAPYIVEAKVDGVDVVTVVTEAPLSYSGIKVKIDTEKNIGEEGADVYFEKRKVGHITTEEYGSKMLSLGGANLLTGKDGMKVARVICDIANRKEVKLKIAKGSELIIKVGDPPIIDGEIMGKMRVGCGSASMGLFGPFFKEAADEVIVIDSHITGLFSEHPAGTALLVPYSGVILKARKSTLGRYFGDHGEGWGGTSITDPIAIVKGVDKTIARPGMTLLITETTGERAAFYKLGKDYKFHQEEMPPNAAKAVEVIASTCEKSRVSAIYVGGAGGSARAGVVRYPLKLSKAVHEKKAKLTVGGAPTFVLPGGGITFMVNVEQVKVNAFSWVPTPATVAPIEYTMKKEDYIEMGGHAEAIKPFSLIKKR
ncbi:MAG: 6-hydroxynicotinate reductase [Spirochaetes bacterium]|nr:MAG: 6-hydroxynicotinate reductase [Spirochaetota bacterium]RLA90526.1 MAG: 6-hydroxynicotinate reductase [Deltaproteobacteria bacterium]